MVSNPIREYLQIAKNTSTKAWNKCFKPYKGVSSNSSLKLSCEYLPPGFKPYKGVSSNGITQEEFRALVSFKPYKGVSSNYIVQIELYSSLLKFQTL